MNRNDFYAQEGVRRAWPGTASTAENYRAYRWELGFWALVCFVAVLVIAAELVGFVS